MGKNIVGVFTDEPHRGSLMCGFAIDNENGEFGIYKDGPELNYAHSNEVIEDGKTYYGFRLG